MSLRPGRLVVVSSLRLLRSTRIHAVALGGALFLAKIAGIGGNWLFPAVYSGLAAAMALYTVALRSRGFLEYASSSLSCPLTVLLLALGAGVAAAVVSIPVSLILGTHPGPVIAGVALLLGASYTLVVLPLGTILPLLAILYIVGRPGSGPLHLVLASILLGLALAPLSCLAGPGGLDLRRRLHGRRPRV
ncbi:MAG: hypothetical protein GSR85_01555 [Desulfurococcales archaeon]|nr:hypothetical protein [Desulfurococcales archaeon]